LLKALAHLKRTVYKDSDEDSCRPEMALTGRRQDQKPFGLAAKPFVLSFS